MAAATARASRERRDGAWDGNVVMAVLSGSVRECPRARWVAGALALGPDEGS
jgi:hypothetical protein